MPMSNESKRRMVRAIYAEVDRRRTLLAERDAKGITGPLEPEDCIVPSEPKQPDPPVAE